MLKGNVISVIHNAVLSFELSSEVMGDFTRSSSIKKVREECFYDLLSTTGYFTLFSCICNGHSENCFNVKGPKCLKYQLQTVNVIMNQSTRQTTFI